MIDTHAHVHDRAFDGDREDVVARARAAGVEAIVTVGCDLGDSERARETAQTWQLAWTAGIHPHEAKDAPADLAAAFDALIAGASLPPCAIGETGLDFFYEHSPPDAQIRVMEAQLAYARDRGFPLVFHQRDAFDPFVETLRAHGDPALRGVVHCFTGNAAQARTFVDEFGLLLGIGGVVTFKNSDALREAVRTVGIDAIVLETDAPYLAPVPARGKRNEPAFVRHTAERVAEILALSPAEVLAVTDRTARALFGL